MKTRQDTETTMSRPQHAQRPTGRRAAWGWRLAKGTGHGAARGFLRFWPLWERFTLWLWKVQPVPSAPHGLFQVSIRSYWGRPLVLPDGTSVASGDPIMELHLVNWRLAAAQGDQPPLALLKKIREDMAAIAQGFQQQRYPSSVRALYGVTILAAATPRLGFTLRPRPLNLHGRLERFFLKGLLALYNADGLARLEHGSARRDLRPQEVWMSVDTLLERYGAQPSR